MMDAPLPTKAEIDDLLRFLPQFEAGQVCFKASTEFVEQDGVLLEMPRIEFNDVAYAFMNHLNEHEWCVPFDWPAWQDEAKKLLSSPEALNSADLETIRRLLTLHVRKERFCEGHLHAVCESGHLTAILRRLRDLRAEMDEAES